MADMYLHPCPPTHLIACGVCVPRDGGAVPVTSPGLPDNMKIFFTVNVVNDVKSMA